MSGLNEHWKRVEQLQASGDEQGQIMAILEAHKILSAVLLSKKYPGKSLEKKLFWAGYSGKDKDGVSEALREYAQILKVPGYRLNSFEAEEIVKTYHRVVRNILKEPTFSFVDRVKAFFEYYFLPQSIGFWKILIFIFSPFIVIKILKYTEFGNYLVTRAVELSNFVISWLFFIVLCGTFIIYFAISNYFKNRSKIVIKE